VTADHYAPPDLGHVFQARRRIAELVRHTPLVPSFALARFSRADVRLKLETFQDTGAFKVRGAANAVLSRPTERARRGVVTYSTGNHGRAVALVARALGVPATVCVSEQVPGDKIAALRRAGCSVSIEGASQDEAASRALRMHERDGLTLIDPINDASVIAGHGTAGLELMEDFAAIDTVVTPVSGGALISGIALVLKAANPGCRVVGVSMDRGAAMYASQRAGRPVRVREVPSLADSLQGGILPDNRYTFRMVRELVDEIVLVSEAQIACAMAYAYLEERLVLEGAGAAPIAALLFAARERFGERAALVLTGSAVDPHRLAAIAAQYREPLEARLGEPAA